jgi:cytoskeletal protein RodZ
VESDVPEDASRVRETARKIGGEMTRDSKRRNGDQETEPLSYRTLILAVVVVIVVVVWFSSIVARVQSPWITPDHFAP